MHCSNYIWLGHLSIKHMKYASKMSDTRLLEAAIIGVYKSMLQCYNHSCNIVRKAPHKINTEFH